MSNSKKILYIITKSNFGGAQRYVFELACAMKDAGHEVAVASGGLGLLTELLKKEGLKTIAVPSFERDISMRKEFTAFRELLGIIRRERPDIVHLNSSKAGGIGAFTTRLANLIECFSFLKTKNSKLNTKIVFTAHGWPFYEDRNILWRIVVWFFSYVTVLAAHRTIVVSRHDFLRARMPFCRGSLHHIPTALPPIAFRSRDAARAELFDTQTQALHARDMWLISTGEFTKNKNLDMLIDGVALHNDTHAQKLFLVLMNDGEDRQKLEARAKARGLDGYVSFLGFVHDARSYLSAFDIFVLPSLKEGLPYGLLEAGAAGLPAIASAVGGIPEIIEHDKNGLLIDPRNIDSLSHAFTLLTENPEKRLAFGSALREKVQKDFSLNNMVAETKRVYGVL